MMLFMAKCIICNYKEVLFVKDVKEKVELILKYVKNAKEKVFVLKWCNQDQVCTHNLNNNANNAKELEKSYKNKTYVKHVKETN